MVIIKIQHKGVFKIMKVKNLINNVLATVGFILFAGCGGYCEAGNYAGAVISLALCFACFYPIKRNYERNETRRKRVVSYRYNIRYKTVMDEELPKAQ